MSERSKLLSKHIFYCVFFLLIAFGMSLDEAYFKGSYGHELYWILVSLCFAGLGRSAFLAFGIAWTSWNERNGGYDGRTI